jgi:hypothetical protein
MKKIILITSFFMGLNMYLHAQSCIVITEPPPLNAGLATNSTQCQGTNTAIDLDTQLSGADTGGTWSISGTSANNPGTQFNATNGELNLSGLSAGTYTLTYTVGAGACTDTENIDVTIQNCCPPKVCSPIKITKI